MDLATLGTLRTRVVGPARPRLAVVLLHGFGASGDDLVSLADVLDAPDVAWVFPEAPLELGGLYGDARAWWMLDLERFERELRSGVRADRSQELPPGLAEARAAVVGALDALAARIDGPVVLGGFSQGAMLALDVALHDPRPLAGLALLSGTLLARREWEPRMPARAGLPVLQAHGRDDELLPYAAAETLRDLLVAAGLDVTWHPFDGGHEIPPSVLAALGRLIATSASP